MKKEPRDKDTVFDDFAEMVSQSWTYARMTEKEKDRCMRSIRFAQEHNLCSGTYDKRWRQLLAINSAFLDGLGYSGAFWREPASPIPQF